MLHGLPTKINSSKSNFPIFVKNIIMKTITKALLLTFSFASLLTSCSSEAENKTHSDNEIAKDNLPVAASSNEVLAEGFNLLASNCFSCHNPNPDNTSQIAPSFAEIKGKYLINGGSKAVFKNDLTTFVQNPSKETSKMPTALSKFGLMPKMDFSKKQLNAVAAYLYESNIEDSDWFANSFAKEKEKYASFSNNENLSYAEIGKKHVMATKSILGKNLMGAVKSKGAPYAVSFCNEKAVHYTDSMSLALNIKIKRVSDKNRNPNNEAKGAELTYITSAKETLKNGNKLKPQVIENDNNITAYYPIMTGDMCMKCHGKIEQQIKQPTLDKINTLYSTDKAINYNVNELRGIWVVEMDKK